MKRSRIENLNFAGLKLFWGEVVSYVCLHKIPCASLYTTIRRSFIRNRPFFDFRRVAETRIKMSEIAFIVESVCLFCFKSYKQVICTVEDETKRLKNLSTFEFLSNSLNLKSDELPVEEGFDFVSESVPLCPSCGPGFDQLARLVAKLREIEALVEKTVAGIKRTIFKSGKDLEGGSDEPCPFESHFSRFRRLVISRCCKNKKVDGEGQKGDDKVTKGPLSNGVGEKWMSTVSTPNPKKPNCSPAKRRRSPEREGKWGHI
jgi:hypothetical protein